MSNNFILIVILTVTLVCNLVKILPLAFFNKEIKNKYIKSFLKYIPYAVFTSMTIPEAFFSTGNVISATVGIFTAAILAFFNRSLILIIIASTSIVFVTELIMKMM